MIYTAKSFRARVCNVRISVLQSVEGVMPYGPPPPAAVPTAMPAPQPEVAPPSVPPSEVAPPAGAPPKEESKPSGNIPRFIRAEKIYPPPPSKTY